MKKHIVAILALAALPLGSCGGKQDAGSETAETVSLNNFAGRWIFDQNEEQSKVIDLSSDGSYVYEVRGGAGGEGAVMLTTPGTYEVTPEGNIRSVERGAGAPDWTGTRKGDLIEFSLNGGEPLAFTTTGAPPVGDDGDTDISETAGTPTPD